MEGEAICSTLASVQAASKADVAKMVEEINRLRAEADKAGTLRSSAAAGSLGDAEGLAGHARAARIRLEK